MRLPKKQGAKNLDAKVDRQKIYTHTIKQTKHIALRKNSIKTQALFIKISKSCKIGVAKRFLFPTICLKTRKNVAKSQKPSKKVQISLYSTQNRFKCKKCFT